MTSAGHLVGEGCDRDESASISLTYTGGRTATLVTHSRVNLPNEAVIIGTKGTLKLSAPMWTATELVCPDGTKKTFQLPRGSKHDFYLLNSANLAHEVSLCPFLTIVIMTNIFVSAGGACEAVHHRRQDGERPAQSGRDSHHRHDHGGGEETNWSCLSSRCLTSDVRVHLNRVLIIKHCILIFQDISHDVAKYREVEGRIWSINFDLSTLKSNVCRERKNRIRSGLTWYSLHTSH